MKRLLFNSLIFKIGIIVIIVECIVLTSLGLYYSSRFSNEIDSRIHARIKLPGILMNHQMLRYESISDKTVMAELVGEELIDGLVIGADRKIYYALNSTLVGKDINQVANINPGWFDSDIKENRIIKEKDRSNSYWASVTPLFAYEGAAPFFYAYIRVNTNASEHSKRSVLYLFIIGSVFCIVFTSLVIILLLRKVITQPIDNLTKSANQLAHGNLEQTIEIGRNDELGILADSFMHMRNAIRTKINDLKVLNRELEARIRAQASVERSLAESEKKYRSIFENTIEGIFQATFDGRFINANPAIARILGYASPLELQTEVADVGKQVFVDLTDYRSFCDRLETRTTVKGFETKLVQKNGHIIWCSISAALPQHQDFTPHYYDGSIEDITIRKQKEQAEKEKEIAQASAKAKSMFLANMSHELRTPLNAVLGFAQLMSRSPQMTEEHQENLKIIIKSGEHLLGLINDVLDMSKIESGRMNLNLTDFDLFYLLSNLKQMFILRAEDKALELIFEMAPDIAQYVRSDEAKLRQILINLLGNAVKFSEKGKVRLHIERFCLKEQSLSKINPASDDVRLGPENIWGMRIRVEDSGPGVKDSEKDEIFEAFVQSGSETKFQEGTGLGLSISRKFARLMGGDLYVHSQPRPGAVFILEIPVQTSDKNRITSDHVDARMVRLAPDQKVTRILVVDDIEDNLQLLVKLLGTVGFDLKEARNGKEAIEVWQQWKPELIFMDMRMPVLDGYEATRFIKSHDTQNFTTVIAVTASSFENERSAALAAGCDDYVAKPFHENDIFDMVKRYLNVKFIHETGQTDAVLKPKERIADFFDRFASLPHSLIHLIYDAALRADMKMIEDCIRKIEVLDLEVARELQRWIDDFEYGRILSLIDEVDHDGK